MKAFRTICISSAAFAITAALTATPVFAADMGDDSGSYTGTSASSQPAAVEEKAADPGVVDPAGIYWDFGIYLNDGRCWQTSLQNWSDFTLPTSINYVKVKGYDVVEGGNNAVYKAGQTIRIENNLALYPIF